jgi:hypothetical protein
MNSSEDSENVSLNLSSDEALVLLEWLHRFNTEARPTSFQDQAEQRVLFDLEAVLETVVSASFLKDYYEILAKARERIRDKH